MSTNQLRSLLFCLLLLIGRSAYAQTPLISIDKVFDQFSSVTVWSAVGLTKFGEAKFDDFNKPVIRYGFELGIGPYPSPSKNPLRDSLGIRIRQLETDSLVRGSLAETEVQNLRDLRARQRLLAQKDNDEYDEKWVLTLGVGLDQSNGYKWTSGNLDIKAPTRGYYLAAYLEEPGDRFFFGVLGGFFDLSGATVYSDSNQSKLTGSTFSFEIIPLGVYIDIANSIYGAVELSWRYLVFEGIRYEKVESVASLRGPQRLNFSSIQLTFGLVIGRTK